MEKRINAYMFIDALGWEIVEKYKFMSGTLKFRSKAEMQFGYSSSAIPTILSGEYPRRHGHFCFFYYDRENSPFKAFKYVKYFFGAGLHPKCLFNRGRVRHKISKIVAKLKGYTGYFQLYNVPYEKLQYFDYCEKTDIFASGGLAPVKNLRDLLQENKIPYLISDWRKPEQYNIDEAKRVLSEGKTDFAFIYTADFDGFMHDNVLDQSAVAERLKVYEKRVSEIMDSLEKSGRPYSFTIISDHGMTPLKGTVPLMEIVGGLPLKFGRDYISFFDSTMLRLWYLNDSAKDIIRRRLSQPDCRGAFLSAEEKKKYGIDFPAGRFGQDIFLCEAGVQISPCDLGLKPLNGMHGFSPADKDSYAAFLSTDKPAFEPKHVRDYFKLMTDSFLNP